MPKINIQNRTEVCSALEALALTPGWEIFQEQMAAEEKSLTDSIENEEAPNRLLRLAGALRIVRSLRRYVPNTIKMIHEQEQRHADKNRK